MAVNLQIIGISGTNGSGKDSAGQTLADRHSYLFVSVTDLLRAELNRRNIPVERENLRALSAEWRREYGLAVLIDRAIEEYNRLKGRYVGVAIASLRNPYEADRIHELGGVVMWVDADPQIRYQRIQNNAEARARAGEDAKSFEEFLAEEEAEMHSANGDAATLDMSAVKKKADLFLVNDNTNLPDFQDFITEQLFCDDSTEHPPVRAPQPDVLSVQKTLPSPEPTQEQISAPPYTTMQGNVQAQPSPTNPEPPR